MALLPKYDEVAVTLCLLLMAAYLAAYYIVFNSGRQTQLLRNMITLDKFAVKHSQKADTPTVTLAIQTFRNTLLVGIFTGGATFQFALLTLGGIRDSVNVTLKIRGIILSGLLMISFLNWACVIRLSAHAGYLVGILADSNVIDPQALEEGEYNRDQSLTNVQHMFRLMAIHFLLGFRFMFFSIPFAFYAAGPTALLVSMGVILVFLMIFDFPVVLGTRKSDSGHEKK